MKHSKRVRKGDMLVNSITNQNFIILKLGNKVSPRIHDQCDRGWGDVGSCEKICTGTILAMNCDGTIKKICNGAYLTFDGRLIEGWNIIRR